MIEHGWTLGVDFIWILSGRKAAVVDWGDGKEEYGQTRENKQTARESHAGFLPENKAPWLTES